MISKLTVLVPVFDEINLIENFTKKLLLTFKDTPTKFIFVDDGSKDGSDKWLSKNLPIICKGNNFELILLEKNYGKGYAIRKGLEKAKSEYILCIDSDLEYDPKDALEIYNIAKANDKIDVIYGSRYLGGKIQLRKHFFNDIAVRINTYFFNLLFDQSLTDLHTGTKVIKKDLIDKLNLTLNGFGLEIDMSSQIAKQNVSIYEYGVSYVERTKLQGKKINFIDGILSYYFLFKARFLQNNLETSISIIYSFIFMLYSATFFTNGNFKYLLMIFLAPIGLMLGINRRIIPLSILFLLMYIGNIINFSEYKIHILLLFFIFGFFVSKRITNYFKKTKKSFIMKLLI